MNTIGLRPFFSYYGSKWRLARHYPSPRYNTIYEPFAGSAGYSLAYPDRAVHLVDKDPTIVGVWDYLIRATPAEILRLPTRVDHVDDVPGPQEARWLVGFCINNAAISPGKTPSAWMRAVLRGEYGFDPQTQNSFWGESKRATIASQIDRIRHWTVTLGSYEDVPDDEATWYVDPPYRVMGSHYRMSARDIDFARLALWCRSRRGQVMVCENAGADWLPFRTLVDVPCRQLRRGKKARNVEAVWTHDTTTAPVLARVATFEETPP